MSIQTAIQVLQIEADAILGLIDRIGPELEKTEDLIVNAKGRIIRPHRSSVDVMPSSIVMKVPRRYSHRAR